MTLRLRNKGGGIMRTMNKMTEKTEVMGRGGLTTQVCIFYFLFEKSADEVTTLDG